MRGISTSSVSTSGVAVFRRSIAAIGSLATAMTSMSGWELMARLRTPRTTAESSTTMTRILLISAPLAEQLELAGSLGMA